MDLDVEALHDFPPLGAFVNLRCIHHPHTGASVILKVHLSPTPRCIRHPHQGASVTPKCIRHPHPHPHPHPHQHQHHQHNSCSGSFTSSWPWLSHTGAPLKLYTHFLGCAAKPSSTPWTPPFRQHFLGHQFLTKITRTRSKQLFAALPPHTNITHICTHTHTYTHTHKQTRTHTQTHRHAHTQTHTHAHTHMHTHTHGHTHV